MIETWKQLQRNMIVILSGAQEAVISIADHVNQHTQKIKLNLDARGLEKEIQEAQAILGEEIYTQADVPLSQLYEKKEVQEWIEKILGKQKQLEATESIVSPYETLHDFERLLIRSDFVIQHIIIPDGFHGAGKTIAELCLPEKMLIFFVKKQNKIQLAYGNVSVDTRDQVTFLCSKEHIQDYIMFWK